MGRTWKGGVKVSLLEWFRIFKYYNCVTNIEKNKFEDSSWLIIRKGMIINAIFFMWKIKKKRVDKKKKMI